MKPNKLMDYNFLLIIYQNRAEECERGTVFTTAGTPGGG